MTTNQTRIILVLIVIILLYLGRGVLGTFVLAGLLAYLLTPIVNLLQQKLKLPRLLVVGVVYLTFLTIMSFVFYLLLSRFFEEVKEFSGESLGFVEAVKVELAAAPDWLQAIVADSLKSLQSLTSSVPAKLLPFFTGAVSHLIHLLIFLTASFYFLKDGPKLGSSFRKLLEAEASEKMARALARISQTFSRYLRGQFFLVVLMSSASFLVLSILNVKFALLLSIFTGFAEIVPIIGPIFATIMAATMAGVDGRGMFGLAPLGQAGVVVLFYFILRQLEDVLVIPHVMSRITGVHPLLVMFAVILGGHLAGTWGLFLAVPVLAAFKIIFELYW